MDDPTLRRRLAALEEENARLRAALDSARRTAGDPLRETLENTREYAIITTNPDGRITGWNAGAQAILGWSADEALGRDVALIFTPEDRTDHQPRKEMETAQREGRALDNRWHLHKDGSRFWANGLLLPLAGGKARGFVKLLRDASDERRAKDALQAADQWAIDILESISDAFIALDRDFRITHHNGVGERISGLSRASVIGRSHWDVWPASLGTPLEAQYRRAMEERVAVELEYHHVDENQDIWLDIRVHPTPQGLAIFYRDITERKRNEAERECLARSLESERRLLRAVVEQMPSGLSVAEAPSGKILIHNEMAVRLLGHPLLPSPDYAAYAQYGALHPDGTPYRAEDYPITRALLHGETVDQEEMCYRRGDGTLTTFAVNAAPVRDGTGAIILAVSTFHDISERKAMENALRASEERLRLERGFLNTLIQQAPVGISIAEAASGRSLVLNEKAVAMLGHRENGNDFRRYATYGAIHPDGRPYAVEDYPTVRALRNGEIIEGQEALYRRPTDGRVTRFMVNSAPVRDDQGTIVAAVSILIDVEEQRRAEEALNRAKREAEQANLAKSKFLAAASHDLRQPMQSLLLFLEVLKPHVAPRGQEALKHLGRGLDALRDLLDSLLDISRLDAGVVEPAVEDFPLSELIDHVAAAYAPVATARGLELKAAQCPMVVRSDRTLLGRMVRNLIENALRYTESGRIAIECRPAGDRLRIEVHDTGIGIPPEHLEWIWEEFHQVGNPERDRNRGLGLGLAIVQRLSNLLDHPVNVRSRPGEGSVFSIEVPLGEEVPAPAHAPTTEIVGSGRLALLVEDDVIVLLGLKATFESWGYEVLAAGSADQALTQLRKAGRRPDVVVADYRLREGRTGTEAILRIRALCGVNLPGILLTGETGAEAQHDAAAHHLHVIHKPVTPRQLGAALETILQS
ncbi:PAS domain S-box protein [Azospirillum sp. sgz302134]